MKRVKYEVQNVYKVPSLKLISNSLMLDPLYPVPNLFPPQASKLTLNEQAIVCHPHF